jgi:hypothetical protein
MTGRKPFGLRTAGMRIVWIVATLALGACSAAGTRATTDGDDTFRTQGSIELGGIRGSPPGPYMPR